MVKVDGHLVDRVGPCPVAVSSPGGTSTNIAGREPVGFLGGHLDTNRMFTNLLGGWLTAADKAAAATINYTKSAVLPRVSDLTQKVTLATGKILVEVGYKLTDCCTSK
jgi:hypothetical protein